ncbi:MAG: ABC transporter ATP-binding protein [Planctomycetota bacterium]
MAATPGRVLRAAIRYIPSVSASSDQNVAVVSLRDVRFAYGDGGFALDVPRLDIASGRAACIGPSGSGKTTLVGLVAGITVPERGTVMVDGTTVSALPDAERRALRITRIGMVFQEFELLEYLTGLENILLPYSISPALPAPGAARDRAMELASAMGIAPVVRRKPRRLSQGERQRVAICRALVTEPSLVICDEPTGNLDPASAARTLDLLFEQVSARGATLLMVTHNHAILDRFDRVIDIMDMNGLAGETKEGAP